MKIVLAIYPRNDKILNIKLTLESLGHEVKLLSLASYREECSYLMKKIDKLGIHSAKNAYNKRRYTRLINLLQRWKPDRLFFVDLPLNVFSYAELTRIKRITELNKIYFQIWLVDPLKKKREEITIYKLFDVVYSYEKMDVIWLKQFGITAYFCPVGYGKNYETSVLSNKFEQDILFVGTPYPFRLTLLETVAQRAKIENWSLRVCGPFFDSKYPWKKFLFRRKYPNLYSVIDNGTFTSKQIADSYRHSRICLNIHGNGAGSCNPRTYEILATGSFELIDERNDYDILEPGKDLVTFQNKEDLLQKIVYYLLHDDFREKIAKAGYNKVRIKRSIEQCLNYILKEGC